MYRPIDTPANSASPSVAFAIENTVVIIIMMTAACILHQNGAMCMLTSASPEVTHTDLVSLIRKFMHCHTEDRGNLNPKP